jgi:hypothetical protein
MDLRAMASPFQQSSRVSRLVMALVLVAAMPSTALRADVDDCREAIRAFKSAREEIATTVRAYANCVAGSDGHDDCSSEFDALKSAHDDFESGVSQYASECS